MESSPLAQALLRHPSPPVELESDLPVKPHISHEVTPRPISPREPSFVASPNKPYTLPLPVLLSMNLRIARESRSDSDSASGLVHRQPCDGTRVNLPSPSIVGDLPTTNAAGGDSSSAASSTAVSPITPIHLQGRSAAIESGGGSSRDGSGSATRAGAVGSLRDSLTSPVGKGKGKEDIWRDGLRSGFLTFSSTH